ncbi:MAG: hypothetical protein J6Z22_07330, partial [Lachnospiraceae bacterium]|nr:hypothetical protein [Lachnospiraceae bacterium]
CYKQTNGQADTETFINDVISHFVEGKSYADLYYLDYSFADSTPDMIYMNGNLTYMAGWTCGTNEDLRYYVARMTTIGDYVYAYGHSSSEYDELMHGEAGGLYLSSLTTTGDPAKISSAGEDKVARTIHAVVTFNGADVSNILADEVVFIGLGDEDLMAQYGLTYDDMPNDYAVVGNDGVYKEYRLSENCPIYVQYPAEGPFQKLCDKARFHNKLTDNTYVYLMELFLDENGIVTFMYEPYRP